MEDLARLQMENRALRAKLVETQNAFQSFAYAVSHDLGAPLRAVTGFSDILQAKYASVLDEKARSYLTFIFDGGRKAQAMVGGLLRYARVYSQGHAPLHVNLNDAAREAMGTLADLVLRTGARLSIDPLPETLCDKSQIVQLFEILFGNALLYKRANVPPEIRVSSSETDQDIEISVSDNGIGIPAQARNKIFQIFKRLQGDEDYPGLGVGLAVAERIVGRHGGKIRADATPDGGSVFVFSLSKSGPRDEDSSEGGDKCQTLSA